MPQAAQTLLDQIQILASPPTNARNFMVLDVYGRGTSAPSGEAFKQFIYTGLSTFHQTGLRANDTIGLVRLNISYINFANIWDGVLGTDPGFQAFGYTNTDSCTQCTADLGCTTSACVMTQNTTSTGSQGMSMHDAGRMTNSVS